MSNGSTDPVERHHPRLDALVAPDSSLEVVADMSGHEGSHWLESPTWESRSGSLLFSDVKANAIWRWEADRGISLFMQPSGYTGEQPFAGQEPGANGLAFDNQGRLVIPGSIKADVSEGFPWRWECAVAGGMPTKGERF